MKKVALVVMVLMLVVSLGQTVMAEEVSTAKEANFNLNSFEELSFTQSKKDPMAGAGLALLLPGGGHYYAEDYEGMQKFGLAELAAYSLALMMNDSDLISIGLIGLNAYEAVDAYKQVEKYNKNLESNFGLSFKDGQANVAFNYRF
jgi:hypothetical protein